MVAFAPRPQKRPSGIAFSRICSEKSDRDNYADHMNPDDDKYEHSHESEYDYDDDDDDDDESDHDDDDEDDSSWRFFSHQFNIAY